MSKDDLDYFQNTLPPTLDVSEAFEDYRTESESEDPDEFLSFLLQSRRITRPDFLRAHALSQIQVSEGIQPPADEESHRYIELGSIAEGGMGEIHLAKDTQLLRKVAVKVLKKTNASPIVIRRFVREAQITAQLDHPNIVPVYNIERIEEESPAPWFVMKLINGKTLREIIAIARRRYRKNPDAKLSPGLDLNSRLEYFLKVCEAISYAHSKGVIHRDLKPANMMVGDFGEVYVMDWGIAKLVEKAPAALDDSDEVVGRISDVYVGATQHGRVIGTLGYMSPEQAGGLPDIDARSDLYALGLVLYELVTLRQARQGATSRMLLEQAEVGEVAPMIHFVPNKPIAPELRAIVAKATAREVEERYADVTRLADDVRRFIRGEEVSVLPDNWPHKVWRWMNRHRQWTLLMILGLVLVSAGLVIFSLYREKAAIQAARFRENRLTEVQAEIANHTHQIDARFLRLEGILSDLASDAIYLIEDAPPNQERLYFLEEYQDSRTAPPDLAESSLYQRAVSLRYPVVKLAPEVRREEVLPLLRRLAPLRHHFRQALLGSRDEPEPLNDDEAQNLLAVQGVPIRWAYIGLESGVMYSFPGKSTYPADYDPRLRPWYRLGSQGRDVYWGSPYVDIQGQGNVLPCATSLYGPQDQFYGVVGIEVTYRDIIQDNLIRPQATGVIESYLLDNRGRIVIRSSQPEADVHPDSSDPRLRLDPYPISSVVEAIVRKESGLEEVFRDGRSRIVVFHRMQSLGWYYVEELDTGAVLATD